MLVVILMTMTFANTMDRNKNQNRAPLEKKQAIIVMMITIILITNDIDDSDK